ncbi:DUF1737 domain-containing protein [Pseudomonas sp. CLCA07]
MKRCPWVLPLVFLLAYAVTGHIHCAESPACQPLAAQPFNIEVSLMAYTQYDTVVANTPEELADKLAQAIADGWQPYGSPVSITEGFQVLQAVVKGTNNAAGTPGDITSENISDASDVGKAVLVSVDAAAARTAIGSGTSDFSGSYNDLSDQPVIPAEGDAALLQAGTDLVAHTWSAKTIYDEIARQLAAMP